MNIPSDKINGKESLSFLTWLLCIFIFVYPFYGFSFLNIGGKGIGRPDWIISLVIIISFLVIKFNVYINTVGILAGIFAFSTILSGMNLLNENDDKVFDYLSKWLQFGLSISIFYVVSFSTLKRNELNKVFKVWLIAAMLISILGIYQVFAFAFDLPLKKIELTNPSITYQSGVVRTFESYTQVSGIFSEPSYFGAYLVHPIIILSVFIWKKKSSEIFFNSEKINFFVLVILLIALVITNSQGAYATLILTFFIMFVSAVGERIKILKYAILLVILLIVTLILVNFFGIDIITATILRFEYLIMNMMRPDETIEVTSYNIRMICASAAIDVWKMNPLIGVGLNNMRHYTSQCEFSLGWFQLLVDQGLIGVISLIALIFVIIKNLKERALHKDNSNNWELLSLCVIYMIVAEVVNGFFAFNWVDLHRWFILGLGNLIIINNNKKEYGV